MRTATLVLAAYVVCTIATATWRLIPIDVLRDALPHIGALTATYLGLHARTQIAPALAGSVVLGYLIDLVSGVPVGFSALTLALSGLIAVGVQRRILVRGLAMTVGFCGFVGLLAAALGWVIRLAFDIPSASAGTELLRLLKAGFATAVLGPLVWRWFRRIDAAFARTHRERDAALEGLGP
jgi:cell shape-determining protein MreD